MKIVDHRDPFPLVPFPLRAVLSASGSVRTVPAGQVLVRQGEEPDRIYVVEAGAVCLASVVPSGRRAVIAILGRGDVLGVEGLVPGLDRPLKLEARTMTPSRLLCLPRRGLEPTPELAGCIAAVAARALDRAQRRLARMLTQGVHDRVLDTLVDLARDHGRPVRGGTRIDLPVTQELIASMIGATRESVNRALRDLSGSGVVVRSGRRYELRGDPLPGSS
jgi:CRP/FNR family cyclic AMP-dependent transcriptional regulator